MARPMTEIVVTDVGLSDTEAAEQQREANIKNAELAVVIRDFGNGIPFSEAVYKEKITRHLQRSAEELLEAGKALYVSYKHTEHGNWGYFLNEIGLEESLARRMIQTAKKFHKPETRPVLQAAGNKTKLFELLVLDDEDLIKVAQGAEDAPITLDEIDRMPTSELRKALREARADSEATKKVLADKNTKIDKLETQLEKVKTTDKPVRPEANYEVLELQHELAEKKFEFDLAVKRIGSVLESLRDCDEDYAKTVKEALQSMQQTYMGMVANLGANLLEDDWLETANMIDVA